MATTVAPLASGERAGKKAPLHSSTGITRRSFVGLSLLCPPAAKAATARAPEGYKVFRDNLDGYEIAHPDDWVRVTVRCALAFWRSQLVQSEHRMRALADGWVGRVLPEPKAPGRNLLCGRARLCFATRFP